SRQLGFADADGLPAPRTAGRNVLAFHGVLQIDSLNVRERSQPCKYVRKLGREVFSLLAGHGSSQLSHLLGEPEECRSGAALAVLFGVHAVDELLELANLHSSKILRPGVDKSRALRQHFDPRTNAMV